MNTQTENTSVETETPVVEAENAPTTVTVVLPVALSATFKVLGDKPIDLTNKTPAWIVWAVCNGVRQSIGDADAGKAGTAEGEKALKAKYERIVVKGEVPSSGKGGPRKSWTEKGELLILQSFFEGQGQKAADAKKSAAKDDAWDSLVQAVLIGAWTAAGLTAEEIAKKDIPAKIAENMEAVKTTYDDDIKAKAEELEAAHKAKQATVAPTKEVAGLQL